ncbi:hypothetical protein F5B22DRAFT_654567 [Xylaria bambusicola]|uniref:uncharacterized protein n=1 Tax=Xylaria bambusicola TaxID=326684 RepID=UPI0020074D9A|nr:uncharacterized protein F5B22DRAFT_654567 [Xylaria bambusicola]KAI0517791.1 hypothetical protein F5B22DRAFT_654567 [Xylaria bambusicola]
MSLNGANRSNHLARIVPNVTMLIQDEYGNMASYNNNGYPGNADLSSSAALGGVSALNYEDSDLNTITRSQMSQDLIAYRYDLEFCQTQLTTQPDLSPQEIRTLQIRILDCGHNIRHCKHRIQILDAQARLGVASYSNPFKGSGASPYRSGGTAIPTGKHKRQRVRKSESNDFTSTGHDNGGLGAAIDVDADVDGAEGSIVAMGSDVRITDSPGAPTNTLQRLGYWDCRLCRSRKYLEAGPNRVPSAPCKWPLKDISKMINHFLDLHTEHTPKERCSELGDALARNRGPFEYWLTRTKGQEIENIDLINDYICMLQDGALPDAMRGLLRAATLFPNTVSNSYKK